MRVPGHDISSSMSDRDYLSLFLKISSRLVIYSTRDRHCPDKLDQTRSVQRMPLGLFYRRKVLTYYHRLQTKRWEGDGVKSDVSCRASLVLVRSILATS